MESLQLEWVANSTTQCESFAKHGGIQERNNFAPLLKKGYVVIRQEGGSNVASHLRGLTKFLGEIDGTHKHADENGFVRLTTNPQSSYDRNSRRPQSDSGNQSPHTDGAFREVPPAYIALHCITPAADGGGKNTIINGEKIFQVMKERFPQEFEALFDPSIYQVIRGQESQSSAMLFGSREKFEKIVYSVHEYNKNVISQKAVKMFRWLDEFLHDERNLEIIALNAGETLIVDNRRALHGRTKWCDQGGIYRDVIRVWYRGANEEVA